MSDGPNRLELVLRRQAAVGRQVDALADSVRSLTRMFESQFRDVHGRLDRLEQHMNGLEQTVRSFASEQISIANQIVNAQQRAEEAHRRLVDAEMM